uniref:Uncharacterized protein n=1 Tax=Arundo donax TaxID=35708 RepID=A0A0A9DCJ8_ARUDO
MQISYLHPSMDGSSDILCSSDVSLAEGGEARRSSALTCMMSSHTYIHTVIKSSWKCCMPLDVLTYILCVIYPCY